MKKCAATTKMVEEACETLHCHDFEVSMRVKGLSAALNVERQTSDELRLQIIQKDLQIEQLRQEVEGLRQRKANSLREQDSDNEAAQGKSLQDLDAIAPAVLRDYAERRIRATSRNATIIGHRATKDGIDTSPLGLFFRCPGRHGQESDGYRYSCTIQEKTFKDVVPDAPEAIANLRFDTIFGLARLLSIYEHERNEERKRLLMLDHKYCSISVTGAQKAFLFYEKFCDHVFRSLILHDGPSLCLPHDGGTGWPIEQINQATNEAVRYAQANSWDEVNVK
ncbi:hypothetical protein V3C99_007973 [Haemonchus contortus]